MAQIAEGWRLDVERGPDWLFIRPRSPQPGAAEDFPLAEQVWGLLERNFTHRLVLELDEIDHLYSQLIGQLVWLHKRIHTHGGLMRVTGLSTGNQEVLHQCRLDTRMPSYASREDAVMGHRPQQPR